MTIPRSDHATPAGTARPSVEERSHHPRPRYGNGPRSQTNLRVVSGTQDRGCRRSKSRFCGSQTAVDVDVMPAVRVEMLACEPGLLNERAEHRDATRCRVRHGVPDLEPPEPHCVQRPTGDPPHRVGGHTASARARGFQYDTSLWPTPRSTPRKATRPRRSAPSVTAHSASVSSVHRCAVFAIQAAASSAVIVR